MVSKNCEPSAFEKVPKMADSRVNGQKLPTGALKAIIEEVYRDEN